MQQFNIPKKCGENPVKKASGQYSPLGGAFAQGIGGASGTPAKNAPKY
jgi:hypothetical protein